MHKTVVLCIQVKMYKDVGMGECSETRWLYAGKAGVVAYSKMFNHRDPMPERCRDWGHDG